MTKPLFDAKWFSRWSYFNRLIVGFSGGLDSTVLLHVLATDPLLSPKLVAVHVNHGISPHSKDWQTHCEHFCLNLGIDFITQSVQFERTANIEEGARIARYAFFSSLLTEQDCLLLAHHLDDQAETLLLHLFRGAGVDGLAAMAELNPLGLGSMARPFLNYSREHLEHYAALHQLQWIEDDSNQDIHYSRNYLRHQIIPLLKAKWPGVVGNIARTATHCQHAKEHLDALAMHDCPELMCVKNSLFIEPFLKSDKARIVNIFRVWLKNNQIQMPSASTLNRLIDELIFASPDAVPEVSWGEVLVRRYQQYVYLDKKNVIDLPDCLEWREFPLPLSIGDTGIRVLAKKAEHGLIIPMNAKIVVRFRQGGEELVLHGQTKKLKKLFQEWGVLPWLRERVPLIYINETLAAVGSYAVSDLFFAKNSSQTWFIWSS